MAGEDFLNKAYDFLAERSPISLNVILWKGIIIFSLFLMIYLWRYAILGIKNKEISVRIKGLPESKFTGREALRISVYYLIMAVIFTLFMINMLLIDLSFTVNPFRVYSGGRCLVNCS